MWFYMPRTWEIGNKYKIAWWKSYNIEIKNKEKSAVVREYIIEVEVIKVE